MNVKNGLVLPINYSFWPPKSQTILMAFVQAVEGDILTLCPVINDFKAAEFFDLIVPAGKTSLACDLVIMGKLQAGFPACALHAGLAAASHDESIKLCLAMPDAERQRLVADLDYLQKNTLPTTAFKVLRGTFLPKDSEAARWRRKFVRRWQSFRLAALIGAVKAQPDRFPQYLGMKTAVETIEQGLQKKPEPAAQTGPANEENAMRIAASAKKRGGISIERSETLNLRRNLAKAMQDQKPAGAVSENLLNGSDADLLELALRLFPARR